MNKFLVTESQVKKQGGVVLLPVEKYRELLERAVPTYYLTGKAAKKADKLVEEGLKEHAAGKSIRAESLREAIEKHERILGVKKHKKH